MSTGAGMMEKPAAGTSRARQQLEVLTSINLHHLSQVFSGQDRPRVPGPPARVLCALGWVSAALSSLSPSEAEPPRSQAEPR
jgi:hypothetical protein